MRASSLFTALASAGLWGLLAAPALAHAQPRTYLLASPLPLPVEVRILADAPGFPQVVRVPAPPAPPVPIPYPNAQMRIQVKQPDGKWSPAFTLPWRAGSLALPLP